MTVARLVPYMLALVGLGAVANALQIRLWSYGGPGAGLFPFIAGALLTCTSLVCARSPAPPGDRAEMPRLLAYCAALALFCVLLELAGFALAAFLFLAGVLIFIEQVDPKRALFIAVAFAFSTWGLFEVLLSVPLPRGLWRM